MQITFFVGNGFDVSCGIHSQYSEFYKWYCALEKSDLEHVNKFRETIDKEIKEGKNNWADFEEALGQYTQYFTVETVQQFIDCYNDASEKLMEYLQQEMNRFEDELINDEEFQRFINGLNGFYLELPPKERLEIDKLLKDRADENRVINFVSYNYTDTLDKCISGIGSTPIATWVNAAGHHHKLSININVVHAHGRMAQHPVFGVNDESQIANKELLTIPDFANIMIKPKCVDGLGELWHDDANSLINSSSIICIFGMSMGKTDKIWFSRIIKWLKADPSKQLIIYWQTKTPSNNRSNILFFSNRSDARDKILNHAGLSHAEKDALGPRIHVIENTENVLRVKLREKSLDDHGENSKEIKSGGTND